MTYEKFEHKAIRTLLEGNDPIFEKLFDQFLDAEVLSREETETGFVVAYKVPEYLAVDQITKKIASVKVKLVKTEMLVLELIISEGLITQLKGTFTSPRTKYSDLIRQLNDLHFLYVPDLPAVREEAVERIENPSPLKFEKKNDLQEVEFAQESELLQQLTQLLAENEQLKERLAEEQAKSSALLKKSEQLFSENSQTKKWLKQEQAKNLTLIEKTEALLIENTQTRELLQQEQIRSSELLEKSEQSLFENIQLKASLEQEQAENSKLHGKSTQLLVENSQIKATLKQEQTKNSDLLEKSRKLTTENVQINELLAQKQARNSELAEKSAQLSCEESQARELLEQERNQNTGLVEATVKLQVTSTQVKELLEQERSRHLELVGKMGKLLSENNQNEEILKQEQAKNLKLLEKAEQLLLESTGINEHLTQKQAKTLELAKKVDDFKKSLMYFKFEAELTSKLSLEEDILRLEVKGQEREKLEPKNDHPENEVIIESQRKKLAHPFERTIDWFLNKILGEKADTKKYRAKTKYHIAVWKLAFTIGINTLFYFFFVVALAIILLSGAQSESGPQHIMGFSVLRVVTPSMAPDLPANSLIIIRNDDPNKLEVGQIATYLREDDGLLITHRIYSIEKDSQGNNESFRLKGDANPQVDPQIVSREHIIGRVVFSSYTIGRLLLFFQTRFVLMIVITICLMVVFYIGKGRLVKKLTMPLGEPRA